MLEFHLESAGMVGIYHSARFQGPFQHIPSSFCWIPTHSNTFHGPFQHIPTHSNTFHGLMCVVVFEWTQVSGVMGVDVLWSSRTVVVVVWSSWMHRGWGVASVVGVVMVVASVVGVIVVVVMVVVATMVVVGRVIVPVRRCYWWAMGGCCQLCEGRMGTELTYDGDNACCRHHLDDVAVPRRLPTRLAVGAGDVALPRCCHLMVRAVLVVGS